jgi:hypothetical protein
MSDIFQSSLRTDPSLYDAEALVRDLHSNATIGLRP